MTPERIAQLLRLGENIAIEFKRCGNGIEADTYESVCSFLNRFGGDLFMGVENDGKVYGVPPKAAMDMAKNFISCVSNPNLFSPTVYLEPEILEYEGKSIIHVRVPLDGEIHSYKGVIYDRVGDADVRLRSSEQIADLGIRKRNIYTEQWLYPHVRLDDLRLDLIPRLQQRAANFSPSGKHPWQDMSPEQILQSAGLYVENKETGKMCLNLAAIMLLGRDDVIFDTNPTYMTDALLRRVNIDRYDDRLIVKTNLIESFDRLTDFAAKHLLDKFFLEGNRRVSLAGIISREMISNTLIHREFSSHYTAKFVIMKDKMYVENACRAKRDSEITPDNLEPEAKNPRIAAVFRTIGHIDTLGSGTRRLFKYVPLYSNAPPTIKEADIFRITVPLDDSYSFDARIGETAAQEKDSVALPKGLSSEEKGLSSEEKGLSSEEKGLSSEEKGLSSEEKALSSEEKGLSSEEKALSKSAIKIIKMLENDCGLKEIALAIHHSNLTKLRNGIMASLLDAGLVELTLPNSLRSPTQKYRLTDKGKAILAKLNNSTQNN
ncbi:MAG: putative DNA binding domain-containing protein [Victivallales bacterium]|nr:putative DNA binding domain-containing protein [Victivallales bacterium]